MKKAKDLSRSDRLEIKILLDKGYSLRAIARSMKRSPNTISYEIRKNSTDGTYDPLKADAKTRLRKRMRKIEWSKIEENPEIKIFVIKKLGQHWNPDEIAGYMKRYPRQCPGYVSKTAIYEWLRTARGERYCLLLYSKRKRVKKRQVKTKRILIPNRVDISRRPRGANNRSRYGHAESDTIVGKKGTPGGVKVVSERKSRLVSAKKVRSMKPAEHAQAENNIFAIMNVKSVTRDNGIENRDHEEVKIPGYFCTAYTSWEKGGVENANKMLRRYFPKGTDFRTVSQRSIDKAVSMINKKPRKILGYRSAREVAEKSGTLKCINRGCPN